MGNSAFRCAAPSVTRCARSSGRIRAHNAVLGAYAFAQKLRRHKAGCGGSRHQGPRPENRVRLCSVWSARGAAGLVEAGDDDLGDPGLSGLQVAVAAGERAHDGELVLAQEIGEADEPRADNNPNPVYSTLAVSDGTTTTNLPAFTAGTPEALSYDLDGNLTSDGRWTYVYNAENRILWMETAAAAVTAGHPKVAFDFFYDYLGRRVRKVDETWNGNGWTGGNDRRFIYRGWNEVAEFYGAYNGGNFPTPNVRHHFWGLDLSGTMQGAGGVGGLLLTWEPGQTYLPMYDALGNIHGMIKAADGTIAAAYEYDAFGNTLRESGPYAASNPFRFSTKYTDIETGLVYYGLRYYSPSLGRFLNKDPIEEQGGLNLYGFCGNNGVNQYDVNGMGIWESIKNFFQLDGGGGSGGNTSIGMTVTMDPFVVTGTRGDGGGHLGNANDRSPFDNFNNAFAPGSGFNGQDSFGYGGSPVVLDPFRVTGTRISAPDFSAPNTAATTNGNNTISGQLNLFLAQTGGQRLDNTLTDYFVPAATGAQAGLTGAPGKGLLQMVLGSATVVNGVVTNNPYSISGGIMLFGLGQANYLGGLVNGPDFKGVPLLPDMDFEIWERTVEANRQRQNQQTKPNP